jgi:serine protease Do
VPDFLPTDITRSQSKKESTMSHIQRLTAALMAALWLISESAIAQASTATLPNFRDIVQRFGGAVVSIRTTQTLRLTLDTAAPNGAEDAGVQKPSRRGAEPPMRSRILRGLGSGFFVRSDGVILTNAHVVENATEVTVSLTDEREFTGRVLGADPVSDVAVVKIDAQNMPTVPIGKPANAQPGDWVLAIGAPFGFENSVTAGVVSAKGRSLPDNSGVPFIQTDVPINPGNSGGPLFTLNGEVIGINSQIYSNTGAYQGMSFAIPIDVAMKIAEQLISTGRVVRAHLGVSFQDVTPALAEAFGLPAARGALINDIGVDTPAHHAGLKAGDVIVAVNDAVVAHAFDLPSHISDVAPGARATLNIMRDRKPMRLEVTLTADEGDGDGANAPGVERLTLPLGLTVRAFTPTERMRAGYGGVVVIETSGNAAKAGVETGDILLAINGQTVSDIRQLRTHLASSTGKRIALLVQREDGRRYLALSTGDR